MANHLNLRQTLLEFDLQGNLRIFSNGQMISLQTKDVPQFLEWLSTDQPIETQTGQIISSRFVKNEKHVVIDSLIIIPAEEVPQISSWLRQRYQKSNSDK